MSNEEILWKSENGKWTLTKVTRKDGNHFYKLDDGWHCDYPVKYNSGGIAYDKPEIIPKYVLEAVAKVL